MDPRAVNYLTQAWMDLRVAAVIINATDVQTAVTIQTTSKIIFEQIPFEDRQAFLKRMAG